MTTTITYADDDIISIEEELSQMSVDAFAESEEMVNDVFNNFSNAVAKIKDNPFFVMLVKAIGNVYKAIKSYAAIVLVASLMIAIAFEILARKNKNLRRRGLVIFLGVVPFIIFFFVYIFGVFYSFFAYENNIDVTAISNELYSSAVGMYRVKQNPIEYFYVQLSMLVPSLVLISVTVGVTKIKLGKYEPSKKRIGLYGFCIVVPIVLILLAVGMPTLSKMFV